MPKEIPWSSDITDVTKNRLVTRGVDQVRIIREYSIESMVFLLIFGRPPSDTEASLLRAVIVSHVSHGITGQSTMAVRMAADCRTPCLNALVAGFMTGSGNVHQGALQKTMEFLAEAASADDLAQYLDQRTESKLPLYGYGHRFHSRDPRAEALMDVCKDLSFEGKHISAALKIESQKKHTYSRNMNIEAACAAVLLDLGFPIELASLIILMGRAPMLAAAYAERLNSESRPFQRLAVYDIVPGKESHDT